MAVASACLLMFISVKDNNVTFKAEQASAYVQQITVCITIPGQNRGRCISDRCYTSDSNIDCHGTYTIGGS